MTALLNASREKLPQRILFDGRDDNEGRALLTVSALYLSVEDLMPFELRFIDVNNAAVEAAVEVLRWDTGLDVSCLEPIDNGSDILLGARLYVSVVFSGVKHQRLEQATELNVPAIVARQFLGKGASSKDLLLLRAAHDPARLADAIVKTIGSSQHTPSA